MPANEARPPSRCCVAAGQCSLTTCPVSATRRSVMPECTRSPSTSDGRRPRCDPSSASRVEHVPERLLGRLRSGVDHELGVLGRLVRVVDAGEARDLAGQRLLVQALGVAVGGDLVDRGVHVDLDELADQLAAGVAGLPVRRDRAADRGDAVAREQVRDERDAQDVRVAVLLGEPEALRQVLCGPRRRPGSRSSCRAPGARGTASRRWSTCPRRTAR